MGIGGEEGVVEGHDKLLVEGGGHKLGAASAELAVSRGLGPSPGDHGLDALDREPVQIPAVEPDQHVVDDAEIVLCRLRFREHRDKDLLPVEVEGDVQSAGDGGEPEQRDRRARGEKRLRIFLCEIPRLAVFEIRLLQFPDGGLEIEIVPLTALEEDLGTEDPVHEMDAVKPLFHAGGPELVLPQSPFHPLRQRAEILFRHAFRVPVERSPVRAEIQMPA